MVKEKCSKERLKNELTILQIEELIERKKLRHVLNIEHMGLQSLMRKRIFVRSMIVLLK